MNRKALGRGLGALLSSDRTVDLHDEPYEVEIDLIDAGPMQPRTHFDPVSLAGLADSGRATLACCEDGGAFKSANRRKRGPGS